MKFVSIVVTSGVRGDVLQTANIVTTGTRVCSKRLSICDDTGRGRLETGVCALIVDRARALVPLFETACYYYVSTAHRKTL